MVKHMGRVIFITNDGDDIVRDVPDGAWDILDEVIEIVKDNSDNPVATYLTLQKYANGKLNMIVMR